MDLPPLLDNKHWNSPSVFAPSALLREARRQKGLPATTAPTVCILDPDGDLVRRLRRSGAAKPFKDWPCYHTELDVFMLGGREVGLVGRVVGASFAVLVAEELVELGCRLIVSLTSAGQIVPAGPPPYFVINRSGAARRGRELPLCPTLGLRRRRPGVRGRRRAGAFDLASALRRRRELDDRRAVPGDCPGHRGRAQEEHSCG